MAKAPRCVYDGRFICEDPRSIAGGHCRKIEAGGRCETLGRIQEINPWAA